MQVETKQEALEREQQEHEERLNEAESLNGKTLRIDWSKPERDKETGNLVFPGGEVLDTSRPGGMVIVLPKGRKAHPFEYKQDNKTGKWSVPKSHVYTYFAYNLGTAAEPIRLSVTMTTPIPHVERMRHYNMLVAKGLKVEPIEEQKGRGRLTPEDVAGMPDRQAANGKII